MGEDGAGQGLQALCSLACGPLLGLCYDLMAAARRRLGCRRLRFLPDLLLSLLAGCAVFLLGATLGEGRVRLFMPLLLGAGGLGYLLLLHPPGQTFCGLPDGPCGPPSVSPAASPAAGRKNGEKKPDFCKKYLSLSAVLVYNKLSGISTAEDCLHFGGPV